MQMTRHFGGFRHALLQLEFGKFFNFSLGKYSHNLSPFYHRYSHGLILAISVEGRCLNTLAISGLAEF